MIIIETKLLKAIQEVRKVIGNPASLSQFMSQLGERNALFIKAPKKSNLFIWNNVYEESP